MTRKSLIEQILRAIYGDQPTDDSSITEGLVNIWITQATAIAAKNNYKENYQIEGIGVVNNSFYTTFKGLSISEDEKFLYKFSLPSIPVGIGDVDGLSRVVLKSTKGERSQPIITLNEAQVSVYRNMRRIPNKLSGYPEGGDFFIMSTLALEPYTASVTLISGGDTTDLNSKINLPDDGIAFVIEYVTQKLMAERMSPRDVTNDGQEAGRVA